MRRRELINPPLAARSKMFCEICGADLLASIHAFRHVSIDHFTTKVAGGGDTLYNLLVTCEACNRHKGELIYSNLAAAQTEAAEFLRSFETWYQRFRATFR